MQVSITILLVFLCLNLQAQIQKCDKYDKAMMNGRVYLTQKNYDKALLEFQAAQIAARECGIKAKDPADELQKVFDGLKEQRDEAVSAKKEAEKQKAIADSKTKEALSQKEANQTQLARNYWNSSQTARAENNSLKALHYSAEAVAITKDGDLSKNLLVDIEMDLPVASLSLILSHGNRLNSAQFSPDGKKILTVGEKDHKVRLWNTETGKQVGKDIILNWFSTYDNLNALFSPDGKLIVTAGTDTAARFWDTETGIQSGTSLHYRDTAPGIIFNVIDKAIFSPDGERMLTIADSKVCIWDRATGKQIGHAIVHEDVKNYELIPNFSPDGKQLLTMRDGTLKLWNADTGEQIRTDMIENIQGRINYARFSPDGKYIFLTSDESLCLWKPATKGLTCTQTNHSKFINTALFSRDGKQIITTGSDSSVRIWYANEGLLPGTIIKSKSDVFHVSFSPDEKLILTSGWDRPILWDAATGVQFGTVLELATDVKTVSFSPNKQQFLIANEDGTVRLWDVDSIRSTGPLMKYVNIEDAALSKDGKQLLTLTSYQTAQLLDVESGKPIRNDLQKELSVSTANFCADGKGILTINTRDNTIRLWDTKTGKRIGKDIRYTSDVESAVASFDGKQILTITAYTAPLPATPTRQIITTEHYVNLWDAQTGLQTNFPQMEVDRAVLSPKENYVLTTLYATARLFNTINGKQVGPDMEYNDLPTTAPDFALFSPDAKNILTVNDEGYALMWETGKGKARFKIRHSEAIVSAVFSNDSKYILTLGNDETVRVWEAWSGKPVGPPIKQENKINSVIFSPNGKHILTESEDKKVRLWETGTGKQVGASINHDTDVDKAAFSPDGSQILTITNEDHTARLWNIPGDLDIPSNLFKLQTQVSTGYELNLQTNELQLIPPEAWFILKREYNKNAREHYKICKYPKYNFWKRFHPEE